MSNDFFAQKANVYDSDSKRVENVDNIANTIIQTIKLDPNMHVMDFGSGTGLLLERIAPHVRKITGVDISSSMIEQLSRKKSDLPCELDIVHADLAKSDVGTEFDGIISSMTLHHIDDVNSIFAKFHSCLREGGFLAISDLDSEDGSFHTEDTGVYHLGFDREEIAQVAVNTKFRDVGVIDASIVHKPHGKYPVFLLIARK